MRAPLPPELGHKRDHAQCDERQHRAPGPAERAQIFEELPAYPIGSAAPEADPESRTDRVVEKEARPRHLQRAGDDAVELTQDEKKAREDDDDVAIALEERLDLSQSLVGDADPAAVTRQQLVAAFGADEEADAVPGDGADPGDHQQPIDVERAMRGEDRAGDEHRLARCREAEIFEEDAEEDGEVAVIGNEVMDVFGEVQSTSFMATSLWGWESENGLSCLKAKEVQSNGCRLRRT